MLFAAQRELELVADRRAEAEGAQPQGGDRSRQRLQPRCQHRAQGPRRGGRPPKALVDAPAAAAAEHGAEAQPQQRPALALGRGEQAGDEQLQGVLELAAGSPFRQLELLGQLLVRAARAQRRLLAAGEPQRLQPGRPEAIGDAARGERRERRPAPRSPAAASSRSGPPPRAAAARACRPASRREALPGSRLPRAAGRSSPSARRHERRSGWAQPRSAPLPSPHAAPPPAPRRSLPPWIPRNPSRAKNASPARSDSTAAPILSSRRSSPSVSSPASTGSASADSGIRTQATSIRTYVRIRDRPSQAGASINGR